MTQPVWKTPAGSLGTIPEGVFYSVAVRAEANTENVYFQLIAGQLPDGVQITPNGIVEGIPKNIIKIQGVPQEVNEDLTSRFAIRAFTRNPNGTVNRLADRTFTLTVTGQDIPDFVTPAGLIGTYYDGTKVENFIQFTDVDPNDDVRLSVVSGELPPGLVLDPKTGLISGFIKPLVGPPGTAPAGYDATQYAQYPFDFSTRSASRNFQFTLELSDGKDSNLRTFSIFVYSKDSMTADTTDFTADNTFITADVTPDRTPVLLTPVGSLGEVRANNFYAFQFEAIDFDGDPIEYSITLGEGIGYDADGSRYDEDGFAFDRGTFSLPPGLSIDPNTGWFYGYIPDQGTTEATYKFAIRVFKKNKPEIISGFYYFTLTIIGDTDTEIRWITPSDLGTIDNGAISYLNVEAINRGGRTLQYRLVNGSDSKLPQGLTLQPSGNITGRVSFNTFALDGGTTTFDKTVNTRSNIPETTFDLSFTFTVNAFASETEQAGYQIASIVVIDPGSGYTSQPTVTIDLPPPTENSIAATAGVVTIENGEITAIGLGNPGAAYLSPPTVTITGGGGTGARAIARLIQSSVTNAVSVFKTFNVRVNRVFNEPYESLYIKCMPPENDRELISQLIQNQDIIPANLVYRADDANFGVAKNVIYNHAYGLTATTLDRYVSSLVINHYWKNLTLGPIRTARALAPDGSVLYEVVYSQVIDNLVNNEGESVGKEVDLAYPVNPGTSNEIDIVYPNSLINMRDQVIDTVGQVSQALPLWMTSKQENGQVLGFVPAWVIAYVKPGESGRVAYNIRTRYGTQLNVIDFKVDRYELNRSQTYNWLPSENQSTPGIWIPYPPAATTFDQTTTEFDGGSVTFITPADRWTGTDDFDKYLVFPRTNILN